MVLLDLFWTFLLIGFVSFGGGYAMIPVIELEVSQHGWMTTQEFTDVIAVAGMSPGPIATNSAIFVGYQTAGLSGAIVSALGMVIPSLLIILIIATFFFKFNELHIVKSAFYGLRPIITGLIIYAALNFAITNNVIGEISWHTFSLLVIFLLSFFALMKLRMHPIFVIALAGVYGIVLY
ncbi:chromate transporter [Gracilibacillus salitolerans]|uniref:Chromate transporter n=1 Tax=Gracilibacillus salitolerans TaxID=2663022 RepID=A0A5Q2TLC6_9BACI|nr:chromate transporter [Gracilibacillus salitolerans]QGH35794.1 chromate transporter [Gracilibacillus salitolerans]